MNILYAQNEIIDFSFENKYNQFSKSNHEILLLKHDLDSINGAYLRCIINILNSDIPEK